MSPPPVGVVVTGMGIVSPIGADVGSFWQSALVGEVGTRRLKRFDVTRLSSDKGGEVAAIADDSEREPPTESHSVGFARRAVGMAVEDAQLLGSGISPERVGVCVGSVMGTRPAIEQWLSGSGEGGDLDPSARSWISADLLSRGPATEHGFGGPNSVISSACASGNSAIALGAKTIRANRADAMVVAGADELSQAMLLMFDSFKSLTPDAIRPFDLNRLGLLLGEGAAALVLEREDGALSRGAHRYGRVMGCANVADAHHITAPHPEGAGAKRAMLGALREAEISPEDIDHISSHGTGTPSNDVTEAKAIRGVFGDRCEEVPISATKSMLGHTQGAASAMEAVVCLLGIRDGLIPPIANLETLDPECRLDVVRGKARERQIEFALSNAFGFGGNIECVVFGPA